MLPSTPAAGHGAVELLSVQPEGKKAMGGAEYLRGARLDLNELFASLRPKNG